MSDWTQMDTVGVNASLEISCVNPMLLAEMKCLYLSFFILLKGKDSLNTRVYCSLMGLHFYHEYMIWLVYNFLVPCFETLVYKFKKEAMDQDVRKATRV